MSGHMELSKYINSYIHYPRNRDTINFARAANVHKFRGK
jgi:hypothetical protein